LALFLSGVKGEVRVVARNSSPECVYGGPEAARGGVGRQFLEVHGGCREIGLDCDVGQAASHGAAQSVVRLGPSVSAFYEPPVASV